MRHPSTGLLVAAFSIALLSCGEPPAPPVLAPRVPSSPTLPEVDEREIETAIVDARFPEALARLNGASKPLSRSLRRLRAEILCEIGRYEESIEAYSALIDADPESGLLRARARVAMEAGRLNAALRDYDLAIEADPSDPYSYLFRAELKERRGVARRRAAIGPDSISCAPIPD